MGLTSSARLPPPNPTSPPFPSQNSFSNTATWLWLSEVKGDVPTFDGHFALSFT